MSEPAAAAAQKKRRWQLAIFFLTWLAYATFYLTRKNYSIAQPAFMEDLALTKDRVGIVITAYLSVYAGGQFINGWLTDRLGARAMLGAGFVLTAALSALMGLQSTVVGLAVVYGLNGFAQSIGWPAVTKAMTQWTTRKKRGQIMGLWGTNYPVGDAAATALAALVLGSFGWRATFFVPAVVVLVVGGLIVFFLRNHPRDVGLSIDEREVADDAETAESEQPTSAAPGLLEVLNLRVVTLGLSYFSVKFVRYTFIFWFGVYLRERFQLANDDVGYAQISFPIAGLIGTITSGWISDRVFGARRAPAAVVMLVGLLFSLGGMVLAGGNLSAVLICYTFAGFFLFGPDMLISGTAAMDFGNEEAAATVAGFVNGMGSIGAALSGWVIGYVAQEYGWKFAFGLLMALAVLATAIVATLWNAKGRQA